MIRLTSVSSHTLDLLGAIAAEQELYYGHAVSHILAYYLYITSKR